MTPIRTDIEEWLDVIGYEGYYQVSNQGRIRSVDRFVNHRHGSLLVKAKSFKLTNDGLGYLMVSLSKGHKREIKRVHRLVAESFIPNPDNKPCINHIDANRSNNNVSNLEWVTYKENLHHSIKIGRWNSGKGNVIPVKCDQDGLEFRSISEATKYYQVHDNAIKDILNGTKKHIKGLTFTKINPLLASWKEEGKGGGNG